MTFEEILLALYGFGAFGVLMWIVEMILESLNGDA